MAGQHDPLTVYGEPPAMPAPPEIHNKTKEANMAKTDVATSESNEVATISEDEQALISANQGEANPDEFVIPLLKLTQALTKEVTEGDARPGEFLLPLTGENFGNEIELIISAKGKGRFKAGKKGARTLVANDTATVPWQDDPFYGQPFSEHPDAEETYSAKANAGEHPWGSGPPIQTTMNLTGQIVGYDVPLRFSMKLANKITKGEARKVATLLDAVLRGRYWDKTFVLTATQQSNSEGQAFYVATVKQGRTTTPEERQQAVQLAKVLRSAVITEAGDHEEKKSATAPASQGGLSV